MCPTELHTLTLRILFLVSVITLQNVINPVFMDKLVRCLDGQYAAHEWRLLASALEVPPHVKSQFEMYYRDLTSPTVKLFRYLKIRQPKLTILDLKTALQIDCNDDIVEILEQSECTIFKTYVGMKAQTLK